MKQLISIIFGFVLPSILFSHSYNIIELVGPDNDRFFLLIKDNHELGCKNENLEELSSIKKKLTKLNLDKKDTLVLVESMWMYEKAFKKSEIENAIRTTLDVVAPNFKGQIRAETQELQKFRDSVAYIDLPLPLEIANIPRNNYVRGESVDPRLALLKLSRLLENKTAKKIKVKIEDIWHIVDKAKKQIEEIYQLGGDSECFDVGADFWAIVEELSAQANAFEIVLGKIIARDNPIAQITLTKKNLKSKLSGEQIAGLSNLVRIDVNNMSAHAWAQDIATIRKVIDPKSPAIVVVASGGMHLDVLQNALVGLGCTVKANIGVSSSEILQTTGDKGSLLAQTHVGLSKELKTQLSLGLENAFGHLHDEGATSTEEAPTQTEEEYDHDPEQDLPSLALPHCENQVCKKSASQQCGGCQKIFYCSKECQRTHWPVHKLQCAKK